MPEDVLIDYSCPWTLSGFGLPGIARQQIQTLREHARLGTVYEALGREGPGVPWQHDDVVSLRRSTDGSDNRGVHVWGNEGHSSLLSAARGPCIVERASTWPEWQARVLADEAKRLGMDPVVVNEWDMRRGCEEIRCADVTVTPSEVAKATFPEELRRRVIVVPFGTDLERFQPGANGAQRSGVVFAWLGGNWFRKGLVRLLQGWRLAELWKRGATLEIAGCDAATTRSLTAQLRLPQDAGVVAAGRVADRAEWLRGADCFILPSVEEGHAQVLLEAGASGLPVIASEACGHPFTDGKHGVLLKGPAPPEPEAIAAALGRMMDDAERRAMGAAHLEFIRGDFAWSNYRDRLWSRAYAPALEGAK